MKLVTLNSKPAFADFRKFGEPLGIRPLNLSVKSEVKNLAADDAVKTTLKSTNSTKETTDQIQNSPISGLVGLIKDIKKINDRLTEINKSLDTLTPSSANFNAVTQERENLKSELVQLTSLTDADGRKTKLGQIYDILNSGVSLLAGGASGQTIERSLQSQQSLLGDNLISQLARGNIGSVGIISSSISSLGAFASSGDYSSLDRAISSIFGALTAPGGAKPQQVTTTTPITEDKVTTPIETTEISYVSASKLALTLRTADPDQLLRAASAGLDFDTRNALVLKLNDDRLRDDEKKEILPQKEEALKKNEIDQSEDDKSAQ